MVYDESTVIEYEKAVATIEAISAKVIGTVYY